MSARRRGAIEIAIPSFTAVIVTVAVWCIAALVFFPAPSSVAPNPVTTIAPSASSTSTTVAGTVTCVDAFGNPLRTDAASARAAHLRCPYSAGISERTNP